MPCIPLHQLLDVDPFSQSSIDALHTTTPTAISSTNTYIWKTDGPPSQLSIAALHTVISIAISRPL